MKVTAEDIAQVLASAPPRRVPAQVTKAVNRSGVPVFLALFGLLFGGFGLIFVVMFFPWRFWDDWQLASDAARTTRGGIVAVTRSNLTINKVRVMAYDFRYTPEDGHERTGRCYTTGQRWSKNGPVPVRYLPSNPDLACVEGARLSMSGGSGTIATVFPLIGFGLVAWFVASRRRRRWLLRAGQMAEVDVVSVDATGAQANNRPIYKIVLKASTLNDGRPVTVYRANPAEVALVLKHAAEKQPVFALYDPRKPARLLFPEALIDPKSTNLFIDRRRAEGCLRPSSGPEIKPAPMSTPIDRRDFIKGVSAATAALMIHSPAVAAPAALPTPTATRLPRWRGFNLLEKFIARSQNAPFRETDFAWMAEWGFNFVRLPLSYHCWSDPQDWHQLREPVLKEIDEAVAFGRRYGIHVCLNFHRAPGYSVDSSVAEPFNLWTDPVALEACSYHWRHFAARYRDVPNSALSFDLLNEPALKTPGTEELLDDATYARVARELVAAIRAESPERLIIADGLLWGRIPVPALAGLGIAQSTRGYDPMPVSHWKAEWVAGSDKQPEPTWPLKLSPQAAEGERRYRAGLKQAFKGNPIVDAQPEETTAALEWNRARFQQLFIRPWQQLEAMGVGVHVGEFGAHHFTPHPVALAWMGDLLACWREAGWGWALWNFRGTFGVLDSGRTDVKYEDFRGHQLDRSMLELLRAN